MGMMGHDEAELQDQLHELPIVDNVEVERYAHLSTFGAYPVVDNVLLLIMWRYCV